MRRLRIAALCALFALLLAPTARADTPRAWAVWIEQDGRRLPVTDEVKLEKKPFAFVFEGEPRMGYAVVATVEEAAFTRLTSEADIARVIRPTNIRAENGDRSNRELLVNAPGALASEDNACQVWTEDAANRMLSFQSFEIGADGRALARREVASVDFYVNYALERQIPLEKLEFDHLYVLITALPPGPGMRYVDPKRVTIAF